MGSKAGKHLHFYFFCRNFTFQKVSHGKIKKTTLTHTFLPSNYF